MLNNNLTLAINTVEIEVIRAVFENQKLNIRSLRTEPPRNRKVHLQKIRTWIHSNRALIHQAMFDDFRKPAPEVDGTELFHVLNELNLALHKIDEWVKPKKVDAPLTMIGTRSFIQSEPRGVCLIISPWNYPFSLCIGPLISAIAAGNSVIIKPSELTPHVSALIKKMIGEIFEEHRVAVFEGGPDVSQYLLTLPFDHIFFTGSPAIGKLVMRAASENLASVTLELGGKTPTVVTESARIKDAAQRIVVAKFINNGQTCVAPDYTFVHHKIASDFLDELINQIQKCFIESNEKFQESAHYARVVNERHFQRLEELLEDAKQRGGVVKFGGQLEKSTKFFSPTVVTKLPLHSRLMQEEIFGPILPIIEYKSFDEVISFINAKPKPLALYLFGSNHKERDRIIKETSSGGVCLNECAIQFLHHNLPFGGINNSGSGKSHGHAGFLAFSHEKSIMKQRNGFTSVKPFYPPYTKLKAKLMEWFLKLF
jgi:aldehyde dehydrogenase (NAD+)